MEEGLVLLKFKNDERRPKTQETAERGMKEG